MTENISLADRAIEAVSTVKAMSQDLSNDNAERHIVRELKQIAETVLLDAFDTVMRISWQVRDLRELPEKIQAPKNNS